MPLQMEWKEEHVWDGVKNYREDASDSVSYSLVHIFQQMPITSRTPDRSYDMEQGCTWPRVIQRQALHMLCSPLSGDDIAKLSHSWDYKFYFQGALQGNDQGAVKEKYW